MKTYNIIKIIILPLILWFTNIHILGQSTDSLDYYLEIAAHNNTGVKAGYSTYEATLQRIPQAGAYPDPRLDMGFYLKPMEIIDGKQIADFKLMQMFPWFGTRKAERIEMTHMSKMAFEQFRETRDNLYLEVYSQWYALCGLQQKLINSRDNRDLLARLEELALQKFASPSINGSSSSTQPVTTSQVSSDIQSGNGMSMGRAYRNATQGSGSSMSSTSNGSGASMGNASGGMSDVLRIQMEIAELDNDIESLLSQLKAEKAKFNVLLNRPAGSEVGIPDTFKQLFFVFDITNVRTLLEEQNPMLGMLNQESLAYEAKTEMDKKMSYPMLGIGVQYSVIGKRMGMGIPVTDMNGKDVIMPMVSLTIPFYRGKYNAQQRESKLWRQSIQEKYSYTLNALESELYSARHRMDDAQRKVNLYVKQSELAQITYNLIVQEFVAGKSDLTNVIQVCRQLSDYRVKKAEAIAVYNTMVAEIQRLISTVENN